jgi:hypothetical protein
VVRRAARCETSASCSGHLPVPPACRRWVIDLSGDGRETTFRDYGVGPDQARAHAQARGVAVNGLAILNEVPELEAYYRAQVIVGSGAFTLAVSDYEDIAGAMRLKLPRDIAYRPGVGAFGRASAGRRKRLRTGNGSGRTAGGKSPQVRRVSY